MDTEAQKVALSDKNESETYIKIFFEIVNKVKDKELVAFSLLYLDGMIEEDRNRIDNFVAIQKSHKKDRQMDLIGILIDFLHQIDPNQESYQRDTAARICIMLIEAVGFDNCSQKALDFHNWFHVNGIKFLSKNGITFVIS